MVAVPTRCYMMYCKSIFQALHVLAVPFFLVSCGVTHDSDAPGVALGDDHEEAFSDVPDQEEVDGCVEVAKAAFAALQSGNAEEYGPFAPSEADYRWIFGVAWEESGPGATFDSKGKAQLIAAKPKPQVPAGNGSGAGGDDVDPRFRQTFESWSEEKRELFAASDEEREQFAASAVEKFAQGFAETRASSSDVIDWASAVFAGIDRSRLRKSFVIGISYVHVYFWVTANGERYTFKLIRTVESGEGRISLTGVVFLGATATLSLLPEYRPLRPDTREGAAKIAFEMLKSGEFARDLPIFPANEDFDWLITKEGQKALGMEDQKSYGPRIFLASHPGDDDLLDMQRWLAEAYSGSDNTGNPYMDSELIRPGEAFEEMWNQASGSVDWSSAVFVGIDWWAVKGHRGNSGMPSLQFWVRDDEAVHTVSLVYPVKSPTGWLCLGLKYSGAGRFVEPLPAKADVAFEEAAEIAFQALQSGSFTDYGPLVPAQDSLEWLLASVRAETGLEKFNRLMAAQGSKEEVLAKKRERCKRVFIVAREKSAEAIDWSSATFAGLNRRATRWWMKQGVKRVRIDFWVEVGGALHIFRFDEAIQHPNGVITDGVRYVGEFRQ